MSRVWRPYVAAIDSSQQPTSISPRQAHTATQLQDGRVIIIGGCTSETQATSDVYEFNTDQLLWKVKGFVGEAPPGGLVGHAAAAIDDVVYLIGGWSGNDNFNDQTFTLQASGDKFRWARQKTSGHSVGNVTGHTAIAWNGVIWVFGGFRIDTQSFKKTISDQLWSLDTKSMEWTNFDYAGRTDKAVGHVATYVEYQKKPSMLVFGGMTPAGATNTLWILDFTSLTWSGVQSTGTLPSPRFHAASTKIGANWAVVGGTDGTTWFNDIYTLNLTTMVWTQINTLPFPQPLPAAIGHVCFSTTDAFFVHGGLTEFTPALAKAKVNGTDWKSKFNVTTSLYSSLAISDAVYVVELGRKPQTEVLPAHQVTVMESAKWEVIMKKIEEFNEDTTSQKRMSEAEMNWLRKFMERCCSNDQIQAPTTSVEISREGTNLDTILHKILLWSFPKLCPVLDVARMGILDSSILKFFSEPITGIKQCFDIANLAVSRAFDPQDPTKSLNKTMAIRFCINLFKAQRLYSVPYFLIQTKLLEHMAVLINSPESKERVVVADLLVNYAISFQWTINNTTKLELFDFMLRVASLQEENRDVEVIRRLLVGIGSAVYRKDPMIEQFTFKHPDWLGDLEATVFEYNDPRSTTLFNDLKKLLE